MQGSSASAGCLGCHAGSGAGGKDRLDWLFIQDFGIGQRSEFGHDAAHGTTGLLQRSQPGVQPSAVAHGYPDRLAVTGIGRQSAMQQGGIV